MSLSGFLPCYESEAPRLLSAKYLATELKVLGLLFSLFTRQVPLPFGYVPSCEGSTGVEPAYACEDFRLVSEWLSP